MKSVTRSQARGISQEYLDSIIFKNKDLVLGNKVIVSSKCDEVRYLSVYKDLFMRTFDDRLYISLTDSNDFNKSAKIETHTPLYYLSNGIAVPYRNRFNARHQIKSIEPLSEYDFDLSKFQYETIIKFLKKLNRQIDKKVSENLRQYYGDSFVDSKSGILRFHEDNMGEMLELVNEPTKLLKK